MTQVGLHSISVNGGRAEGESSAVLDDQDCQSGKMEAFGRLAAGSMTVHLTVKIGLILSSCTSEGRMGRQVRDFRRTEVRHIHNRIPGSMSGGNTKGETPWRASWSSMTKKASGDCCPLKR